jgi:hypothetical protein
MKLTSIIITVISLLFVLTQAESSYFPEGRWGVYSWAG